MKPWLRLTLITVTVGGGFTGVAITFQSFLAPQNPAPAFFNLLIILAFLALFAFITVSGLIFVHSPEKTTPLIVSLALQIPWVSSPIIRYKVAAGFQISVALIGGRVGGGFRLGTDFEFYLFRGLPWGVGINFFALALLILLLRAKQSGLTPPAITASSFAQSAANS